MIKSNLIIISLALAGSTLLEKSVFAGSCPQPGKYDDERYSITLPDDFSVVQTPAKLPGFHVVANSFSPLSNTPVVPLYLTMLTIENKNLICHYEYNFNGNLNNLDIVKNGNYKADYTGFESKSKGVYFNNKTGDQWNQMDDTGKISCFNNRTSNNILQNCKWKDN